MSNENLKELKGRSARETTAIMMQSIKNILRDAGVPDPDETPPEAPAKPVLQQPPMMRARMPDAKVVTPQPPEQPAPDVIPAPEARGGLLSRFFGKR